MNVWKHTRTDNGGAAGNWKVLSIRPPLRCAMAFADIPNDQILGKQDELSQEVTEYNPESSCL